MVGQRNLEGDRTTVVAPRIAHFHSEEEVRRIAVRAQSLRIEVLKMVFKAQSGHLGGAFSAAELVASLYWHHLRIDPTQPTWSERDRFLLSKGHASALLYAALAHRGFFPVVELPTFRHLSSRLNGHPDRDVPGVEIVAGPLGHGVVWEGAMTAAKYRLNNLVAIVDANGVQQTGATSDVMPLEPLAEKWRAFGWHVQEIDGHNVAEVLAALDRADEVHAQPAVIIARTTKGKGVSFM